MTKSAEQQPVAVPETAKRAGEILRRWGWVEPTVWTERMLTALDEGVKGNTVQRIITTVSGKVFFKGGRCRCSGRFFFHFDIFRLITRGLIRLRRGSVRSPCISQSNAPIPRLERRGRLCCRIPAGGISGSESTP